MPLYFFCFCSFTGEKFLQVSILTQVFNHSDNLQAMTTFGFDNDGHLDADLKENAAMRISKMAMKTSLDSLPAAGSGTCSMDLLN